MALDDEQLRNRLTNLGCDVGPIDNTTRPLYVSLLKRKENDARGKSATPTDHIAEHSSTSIKNASASNSELPRKRSLGRSGKSPRKVPDPSKSLLSLTPPSVIKTAPPKKTTQTTDRRQREVTPSSLNTNSTMYCPSSPADGRSLFSSDISPVKPGAPPSPLPMRDNKYMATPRNKYARRPLYAPNYCGGSPAASSNGFSDDELDTRTNSSCSALGRFSFGRFPQPSSYRANLDSSSSRRQRSSQVSSHIISKCLFGLTVFVFFGLAFIYFSISSQSSSVTEIVHHNLCESGVPGDCIDEEIFSKALEVKQNLHGMMDVHNYRRMCAEANSSSGDFCLSSDAIRILANDSQKILEGALYLIKRNAHWGLMVNETSSEKCVYDVSYTAPMFCRAKLALKRILSRVLLLTSVAVGSYGIYWFFQRRKMSHRERKRLINGYVEDITDLLTNNAADNPETPYLAILDIRRRVLPDAARKKSVLQLWKEVEEKFEVTESPRVSREKQRIKGEWFVVWRWLPPPSINGSNEKVWQGKAFDGTSGGQPLTKCLKIKNMFAARTNHETSGADFVEDVKQAILEKCGSSHGILHMHVVENSPEGLVYAKLESLDAAGDVHKKLHGSWFSGRLVTAKYLTEERYNQKFPDSGGCISPIKV